MMCLCAGPQASCCVSGLHYSTITGCMNHKKFTIAFWHPFGPHGRETTLEILKRKQKEIENNGWTLWSFQRRAPATLDSWQRELACAEHVFVFCSDGHGAVDPAEVTGSKPRDCKSYRFAEMATGDWRPMPPQIRIPHPFRPGQTQACAFVVQQVTYPLDFFDRPPLVTDFRFLSTTYEML